MAGIGAMGDLARINTNVGATNSYNHLRTKNRSIQQLQEQLATGRQINRASDSPANYVIAKKMTSKMKALSKAQENIGEAVAAMQEADTAIAQIQGIMLDMKQLTQQAQTDTMGLSERQAIEFEIRQYASEIDDIAEDTNWQGVQLLQGDVDWKLQVGEKVDDNYSFALASNHSNVSGAEKPEQSLGFNSTDLGLSDLETTSHDKSKATWSKLNEAELRVLDAEERIGSVINRLSLKNEALEAAETNTQAAISRIQDVDVAKAQMTLAKENILQQIALVMLSQNEQAPGAFLNLFR